MFLKSNWYISVSSFTIPVEYIVPFVLEYFILKKFWLSGNLSPTAIALSEHEISILGGQDKMVQGFDEAAGLHYYKLYYQKEK